MAQQLATNLPCPDAIGCGSSDAAAEYEDAEGRHFTVCYSCQKSFQGEAVESREVKPRDFQPVAGEPRPLPTRGIHQDVCEFFGYRVGKTDRKHGEIPAGSFVQICPHYDRKTLALVGQQLRDADKNFAVVGDVLKKAGLPGFHKWRPGGKRLVITEGFLDTLSYAQITSCRWPVVSLPNGAPNAVAAIQANLEYCEAHEAVVFLLDNDEKGKVAAEECAALLTPGKAFIARLPLKDANAMLLEGRAGEVIEAVQQARPWRPGGILSPKDLTSERVFAPMPLGFATPYPLLDEKIGGLHKGRLLLLIAGAGLGKSTLARILGHTLIHEHDQKVGEIRLEEDLRETVLSYIGLTKKVALDKLEDDLQVIPEAERQAAIDEATQGKLWVLSHFGSLESTQLLSKMRYLAVTAKVDFILLDHVSIAISGLVSSREGERRDLDILMTKLRELVQETGVGVIAIAHLRQPQGTPHEEGGRVSLSDVRGSGALKQIPDTVVALEGDQQGSSPNIRQLRVLKSRRGGRVGPADTVEYSPETGWLLPTNAPVEHDDYGGPEPF